MQIVYNGVDITSRVQAAECKYRDVSGGRSDSLHMVFNNGLAWNVWRPEKNDCIEVYHDGIYTGKMYVQAAEPKGDKYRLIATAARADAGRKKTKGYENITLRELMGILGAEDGMEYRIFGLDEIRYGYLIQQDESNPKFLSRVLEQEGAVLKCYNGRYTAIGIAAAQAREAAEVLKIGPTAEFCHRIKMEKIKACRAVTPWGDGTAKDRSLDDGQTVIISCIPARTGAEAYRMAKGTLISRNRQAEEIRFETDLRPNWTAMQRIDITGPMEASGEWLVDEAEHDFIRNTTKATFLRAVKDVE